MKKADTYKKTREELHADLEKQRALLSTFCELYDKGDPNIHLPMSVTLRTLVHNGSGPSLLTLLKLQKDLYFHAFCDEINPNNIMTDNLLCAMRLGPNGAQYIPLGKGPIFRKLSFPRWWNAKVIKDQKKNYFTRRDIVLSVANKDGGAHVDHTINDAYKMLTRDNTLGWSFQNNDGSTGLGDPIPACIRQIAHELLSTISANIPGAVQDSKVGTNS